MTKSFMPWYERELEFLRMSVDRFSREHPMLAKSLGASKDGVEDPHVARVIESFALLTARLSQQLSEESTQLSAGLLEIMFPLILEPLPSACLLQVPPSADLSSVITLPENTRFRASVDEERYCQFHITRDLQLCPFDLIASSLEQRPFSFQIDECPDQAIAVIKLDFCMLDHSRNFHDISDFDQLFIHMQGLPRHLGQIYDHLCRHRCKMMLMGESGRCHELPDNSFEPLGFSDSERMLQKDNHTFYTFQVLLEFFAWPELFHGFLLKAFGQALQSFYENKLTLCIFLDQMNDELTHSMGGAASGWGVLQWLTCLNW